MQRSYSIDYNIERDIDRVAAIKDILDTLKKDPSPKELEQMASYILNGKDENGMNAAQRHEIMTNGTRFNTFRRKEDKNASLEGLMENPMTQQQEFREFNNKDHYVHKTRTINRPKYNKKTGELIDMGDGDIPGMLELWESIDNLSHLIGVNEGKIPATEDDCLFVNPYRMYQLKHQLVDLRRHQYYLKDSYKPVIHLLNIDHPRHQFVNWTCDTFYWISFEEWGKRVKNALTHKISHDIKDYETRYNKEGELEVKWIVNKHHFDWTNYIHIRAFLNHYDVLYLQLHDKVDTYGHTLLMDFERYRALTHFSPLREWLIDEKLKGYSYAQIQQDLITQHQLEYNETYLSTIYTKEIPKAIAAAAKKQELLIATPPENLKTCFRCQRKLPRTAMFFSKNKGRKDGFASNCKECEKKRRIDKGGQTINDRRYKDQIMLKMQTKETRD